MQLVKDLTAENSRLIRDNKQANASLDSMVKDNTDLTNRLFDIALQSPDEGGDLFDDAYVLLTQSRWQSGLRRRSEMPLPAKLLLLGQQQLLRSRQWTLV